MTSQIPPNLTVFVDKPLGRGRNNGNQPNGTHSEIVLNPSRLHDSSVSVETTNELNKDNSLNDVDEPSTTSNNLKPLGSLDNTIPNIRRRRASFDSSLNNGGYDLTSDAGYSRPLRSASTIDELDDVEAAIWRSPSVIGKDEVVDGRSTVGTAIIPLKPASASQQILPQLISSFSDLKSSAQGLMDFAFLTANASQLRYVLRTPEGQEYRTVNLVLISSSIFLQILVGVILVFNSYYKMMWEKEKRRRILAPNSTTTADENVVTNDDQTAAMIDDSNQPHVIDVTSHISVALIFVIAILNIFIASFGVQPDY